MTNTKFVIGDKVSVCDFSGICTITQVGSISRVSGTRLYVVRNEKGSELIEKESDIEKI